ncbi:hypothetical protein HDV04_005965 [Boothiomyces sp. JEL0838]|nr:hypothetical protein HDV04_005965 [Boothiomyces sp. JEL0838]
MTIYPLPNFTSPTCIYSWIVGKSDEKLQSIIKGKSKPESYLLMVKLIRKKAAIALIASSQNEPIGFDVPVFNGITPCDISMDVFLLSEPPLFDDSQLSHVDDFAWPAVQDKEQPKAASPLKEDFHFFEEYPEMQVDYCPLKRCGDYGCLELKRARTDSGFDDLTNVYPSPPDN